MALELRSILGFSSLDSAASNLDQLSSLGVDLGVYGLGSKPFGIQGSSLMTHAIAPSSLSDITEDIPTASLVTDSLADWTILIYLDGDNNLETAAIDDFLEMAAVGSNADLNIVVQMDRIDGYDSSYDNWTRTRRGLVQAGDLPTAGWGTDLGEVNMGDQATLTDFIQWGTTNYQAENYAVVLWNHGGGWNTIAGDDSSGYDFLSANEVSNALASSSDLDLVGADACLMGMTEFAYQIRNSASVFVGSEELEPGDGWDYTRILSDLSANPQMDARALGSVIVDAYADFYTANNNLTLSAIDLTQLDNLGNALSNFATVMMGSSGRLDLMGLNIARSQSTRFGGEDAWYYNSVDLGNFLSNLLNSPMVSSAVKASVQTVLSVYNLTVFDNFAGNTSNATGLGIYLPGMGEFMDPSYTPTNSQFAANTQWDEFLQWWG